MPEQPECANCNSTGWVCEAHEDRPWLEGPGACECGAPGMPCPVCNPCDEVTPPRELAGFIPICDLENGWYH